MLPLGKMSRHSLHGFIFRSSGIAKAHELTDQGAELCVIHHKNTQNPFQNDKLIPADIRLKRVRSMFPSTRSLGDGSMCSVQVCGGAMGFGSVLEDEDEQ